ncbi:tetratricopeptide repeat protein [Geobacter sp. FeAm09]|uniref:tetratricopeptide repeat protein n=1 Tax=Geobacter sp. FeAm09 TaxID=2597769 RepID=UPI0011EEB6AE|nr:tetratricopeptide repeat protein [Geobacter sp. FeAm09]QEM68377.1 tetratricopeptide repeat protein [Geobacter sp. FeAm09]
MKFVGVPMLSLVLALVAAVPAFSGTQLYRGTMEAVTAPSKSCEGVLGKHPATFVITEEGGQGGLSGYLESEGVFIGTVVGSDLAHLRVTYPGQTGSGNPISLTRSGVTLIGELNGATTVNHCTFDLGRLTLNLVDDKNSAQAGLQRLSNLFEAQTTLYQAFSLTQNGSCEEALPLFEKALGLADSVFAPGAPGLTHFIRGVTNCYAKLGRAKEFNELYDKRISTISDESLKTALTRLRISALTQDGRMLLTQGEYEGALKTLMQAYQLNPQSKEIIHTVMAVYIRSGRYGEAVGFLEQAAGKLEEPADRKEINDVIALVYFKKALKDAQNDKGEEAEVSLRKSVALDPGNAQYLVALARMRHKAGHFDEAQSLLSQGLERITDEPSRQEILAMQEKLRQTEMIIKKLQ